ncbi:cobalt-zinc-cadmium efflux system protein [Thermoanaerobacter thermohydrosulfuricus]|uniref:Cobalt-zinc-cadmium efflux system protein n=2 Tax=Thermoanaerobacter TaxID=1754 RepID=A0A1G7L143_THETY|nr:MULTISPECIES: cation diffusion facilitator family transporter [Thermoanaerobacter]AIS51473.1 cadmium, cobalt and zinc/H(+)-K(+) antiporter CzcD [Thermoanaerobacter kivui]SDF43091.1 cobalt-zinc-cadmium efflux system protein [Thermoanaerobacter thermohydrosulfuricus]HHY79235.1 cation transporter [Thermoanaerobacter sp.]
MAHHHDHGEISKKNLVIAMILNFVITIGEIIGGILSGSLSLISDALHNFSDGISIIVSYIAIKISKKENNEKMTFGYKRAEILAALFNSVVLVVISLYLFKEAYVKFFKPEPIDGVLMIVVAIIGLVANTLSMFLLRENAQKNLNIKSTYIHLLSDALSSLGVVIGGIFIYAYNIYWIDPLLTVLIGAYIIKESFEIIDETIGILMQKTPENINLDIIKKEIEKLPDVKNIHHVHVWQTNDKDIHFECHVNTRDDIKLSQAKLLMDQIETILDETFGIHHVTLQMEYECCENVGLINRKG